jgi:ABC-type phosphate transport system permease subunit
VPSIIYGMFGLFVFAPIFADYIQTPLQQVLGGMPLVGWLFGGAVNGMGILAAGIVLAFMILPFIAAVMRDVFEIVPPILRESAYGLGCTTWEVVRKVVLPYTQKGVIGGVMLGLGRALGETMAVTFVIGNANRMPTSLFSPGTSIASVLANEFGEAADLHLSTLFALGFLLFVITFVVLALAKLMIIRAERAKGLKGMQVTRSDGEFPLQAKRRTRQRRRPDPVDGAMAAGPGRAAVDSVRAAQQGAGRGGLEHVHPVDTPAPGSEGGGLRNAIVGSLMMLGLTVLVSTPIGILAGIYLAEYGDESKTPN